MITTNDKPQPQAPNWDYECETLIKFPGLVGGVDEAGRGPLAGPVVAGAVILNPDTIPAGLNDSKKLTAPKREELFEQLTKSAHIGVGVVSPQEIDEINILQATLKAMALAVEDLPHKPQSLLIDGNRAPKLSYPMQTIIKGDSKSLSIAAASIIAKVTRDRIMLELEEAYPAYGFARHKGYGTKIHKQALKDHGPCPVHRFSFAPVKQANSS